MGPAGEPGDVADVAEQAGGVGRSDAGQVHQPACGAVDQVGEFLFRDFDLLVDDDEFADQLGGQPSAGLADHVARTNRAQQGAGLLGGEEREWAVLQWSAEFADHGSALQHAERMATLWLGIKHDCNQAINAEVRQELGHNDLATRCRALELPVLIIDGTDDIRPRWAVDSLHQALADSQRMSLAGSGHLPCVLHRVEANRYAG
ncbi:hypothetical protein [Plantactinospora sp. KLBMP9567]|uniref:hypothetical protein n=1 Tax=Plantactinospora sp. KLBMP9567 TaxID=3085900 RepID=UPI002981C96B|nr:hypothetical protein [Plantactinospora sp. KLBMP9567]MDW5329470.1 hypothetical protein [Plantactinospora sp. KLBMP9567]